MIRTVLMGAAAFAAFASVSAAGAKMYVDYTPEKGAWEINAVEVDPNHVDDYLVGLRHTQIPLFEILKKHALIDDYKVVVRNGYTKGSPNVLIETHVPSLALLEPDKARDMMLEKEMLATLPEEQGKAAIAGYEKYRQFLDDAYWSEVTFAK
ncbi:hypothetical protein HZF05_18275 [Sphingomonas sp. CGMCC 1.13654]|uniref:DUF3016 domain-containing protein n=1 Tax=Sphingomonas chungangi TaxID=2683589 RepID=A0A838LB22_9SPHN|nr:hypothetical protein [Sphingomonas chungangi]MBA2936032.1 hypothetical protein [Sphingomonas chungangi]MVW55422.1 hypothetical protein [Sphingomonas chungangi]